MRNHKRTAAAALAAAALALGTATVGTGTGIATAADDASRGAALSASGSGHYDHVFVIVEENHGFTDVIGNPAAPNLNALASQYGIATDYTGVTHPSEPNYVALLGGDTFGVNSDNAYYTQKVAAPSLITQLDAAHLSWKAYLQSVPHPGYQGICYPASCNGAPDKDPLYVSKHDGIQNFVPDDNPKDWNNQVPVQQLSADLRANKVPDFGYIIPDECHDQHGDPPYCLDSGNPDGGNTAAADPQDQRLVATGDAYLGQLVQTITGASFWGKGNNAIAITYDEGNDDTGGGGRVATVLVTSHGPRGVQDPTAYNHYSLLDTIERNFGLACLAHACDTTTRPLSPLLTVTGARAQAYHAITPPAYSTPTPVPAEPITYVSNLLSRNGWSVQAAPQLGTGDNTFGSVAAVSANDVWAVGNWLPDASGSNLDATLTTAAHYDGTRWTSTPTPAPGSNFSTLFGVAALPDGRAWAVGVALDGSFAAHAIIESWDGKAWRLDPVPALHSQRDILYSVTAVDARDVWAAGLEQNADGTFQTLIEHFDGTAWQKVDTPNPGAYGDQLYAVSADGPDDVYAVGQRNDRGSDTPLVLHFDGRRWKVAHVPATPGTVLQAVTVHDGQVWAVGQTDDSRLQAFPVVDHLADGHWSAQILHNVGSAFSDITGVSVDAHGTPWLVGTAYNTAQGKQIPVAAELGAVGWTQVAVPDPGTGDTVFGGVSAAGGDLWAVGFAKTAFGRSPLIELAR
jgi:hypothetical protein